MSEPTQVSFDDLHQFSPLSSGTPGLDQSYSGGRTCLSLLVLLYTDTVSAVDWSCLDRLQWSVEDQDA